jgi:organic hydroperoxide reductase OsmC/OhrA
MSKTFTLELTQIENYQFEVRFDNPAMPSLRTDEPAPLGSDTGPNPSQLLVASVANCLSASLLFAMRKFKNEPGPIRTTATATLARNEANRLRITGVAATLQIALVRSDIHMAERILDQFEDFCVVTQSVRAAIPVTVRVLDRDGAVLKA